MLRSWLPVCSSSSPLGEAFSFFLSLSLHSQQPARIFAFLCKARIERIRVSDGGLIRAFVISGSSRSLGLGFGPRFWKEASTTLVVFFVLVTVLQESKLAAMSFNFFKQFKLKSPSELVKVTREALLALDTKTVAEVRLLEKVSGSGRSRSLLVSAPSVLQIANSTDPPDHE